jgi:hypothetical protein
MGGDKVAVLPKNRHDWDPSEVIGRFWGHDPLNIAIIFFSGFADPHAIIGGSLDINLMSRLLVMTSLNIR